MSIESKTGTRLLRRMGEAVERFRMIEDGDRIMNVREEDGHSEGGGNSEKNEPPETVLPENKGHEEREPRVRRKEESRLEVESGVDPVE